MRKEATNEEWKKLYDLAFKYKEQMPWKQFRDMDLFSIKFSEEEIGYFTILGNAGECIGLSLYLGEEGLNDFMGLIYANRLRVPTNYIMHEQNCISMYLGDRDEVSKEQYGIIKDLQLKFRGKGNWIYFESYEKGYIPYIPDQEEVQTLIRYLEQLVCAITYYRTNKLAISFEEGNSFQYSLSKSEWAGKSEPIPSLQYQYIVAPLDDELAVRRIKNASKKRWNGSIEMDMFYLKNPVKDDEFDKPFFPKLVVMVEEESGLVLYQQMLSPYDDDIMVLPEMLKQWILDFGVPNSVIVANTVIAALVEEICNICEIILEVGELPEVEELQIQLNGFAENDSEYDLGDGYSPEVENEVMDMLHEMGIDLEDWKKKANSMSEQDFTESLMEEMLQGMEKLGVPKELLGETLGDEWGMDYHQCELKNRKEKKEAIKDFFGKGKLTEEIYEEYGKDIFIDYSTSSWEEQLKEMNKLELQNIATKMNLDIKSNLNKSMLCSIIMSKWVLDPNVIMDCMKKEDREFYDLLLKKVRKEVGVYWEMGECPCTMNNVLALFHLGIIDVGYGYDDSCITLEIYIIC